MGVHPVRTAHIVTESPSVSSGFAVAHGAPAPPQIPPASFGRIAPPRPTGPTTATTVCAFLNHCRVVKGLSACTLRAYKSDLADFERSIGSGTTISEVDRDRIQSYVRVLLDRGLKQTTIKRRVATLKV